MLNHRVIIKFLIIFCATIIGGESYRILGVFPMNSKSHSNMFDPVMKGLAKRGHIVDVISHFPIKNPPENYRTIINLDGTRADMVNNLTTDYATQIGQSALHIIATTYGNELCDLLKLEQIQNFIKNPPRRYDAVITEAFSTSCFYGLGHLFKVPVITMSTLLDFPWITDAIRNPPSTAFAASVQMKKAGQKTFFDRLISTWKYHYTKYRYYALTEKYQTDLMRKYISPDLPSLSEIETSVALMFVNYHHTLYGAKPFTPAVIPIGGIHAEQNDDEFTPELKNWMDDSTHGVVYFSFGSMILIESISNQTLRDFYTAFSKIAPVRVLMKVPNKGNLPPGLPENVRTAPWIPQVPVLKHNNTKLFITHGGLMGTQEALYYGIPLIGFPFFSDQFPNMDVYVNKGMAIRLHLKTVTEEKLTRALKSILTNPNYRKAAKHESRLFRDRPMKIMDTANYWIEYVIRNGGDSLRSPALDLYWWQVELLDVYGFLLICFVTCVYLIVLFVNKMIQIIAKSSLKKYSYNSKKND